MNPNGHTNQVPTNSNAIPGSSSLGNNYPWNVVNPNAQANRYLNDVLTSFMGNALLDSVRPQNLYGLQPSMLNPLPLQFQPLSGNPLIGGDSNPFLWNNMLNSMLLTLGQISQNAVNNNPLWATGFQNFSGTDAFFNRPVGAALENIRLPNNGQQDNGILQNPAILPNLSDNRSSHPFLERHSEEFHLTNPVVQTLLGTSLVHSFDGGNNSGIPIPKTSGDFPAESSIGRNNNDVGQNQSGASALSTTSTQTESFDHFNPLPPVVPTSGNSHDRGRVCVNYPFALSTTSTQTELFDHFNPLSHVVPSSGISHDCAKVYVNHPGDGRGTTFVDEESLPEESRTLSQYEGIRTASDEPFDNTVNRAQFTKELPLSNKEESGGFGGKRLNSLLVEPVQSIPQEQLSSAENAGFVDTTGTVPLQDNDLNNNATTAPYVVSLDETAVPQTDILPEVAEPENGDMESDISSQVPTTAHESETVSSSETTTLFCGLEGCSQYFIDSEQLCRHLKMDHSLPTYVVTIDLTTKMEYLGFHNEYLSNEFFHKIDVDGNYTVYTCQRLLPGGKTTALRLVEATRGEVSSLYDQDYKGPMELQPRRGPFVRQGGFCPAFVMVKRDGERYNVKICDWHLHGSVIPTRALEMIGTMLLLKNLSPPLVRVIIQGQTTEFCTPMSSLDLYIRRLDLKQFECLCDFVLKRYAGHIDVLRRKMGYLELTRFERSCITEYLTRRQTLKAKYTRNNNDVKEANGVNSLDLAGGSSSVSSHHLTEEDTNTQSGMKRECSSFSSLQNEPKRCNTK